MKVVELIIIGTLIVVSTVGRAQEIIELEEGKVDTIYDRFAIKDIIKVHGKKIIKDPNDVKSKHIKLEKKKHLRYIIRDDVEERLEGVKRRYYIKVSFTMIFGTNKKYQSYGIFLIDDENKKTNLYGIRKGDTIEVCMYCEKGPLDIIALGYSSKYLLILLLEKYEIPLYALRVNTRFCYLIGVENIRKVKKN